MNIKPFFIITVIILVSMIILNMVIKNYYILNLPLLVGLFVCATVMFLGNTRKEIKKQIDN